MTRREELQKQYAGYERKLDELKETAPENVALKIDDGDRRVKAFYSIEKDGLKISEYAGDDVDGIVTLSGDEAEKLYHFLGGLYGG
jgi:hypothetical protein